MQKKRDGEMRPEERPRGRPRAFDRDAALDQAVNLFWTKGYEATSITDLTAAMGIGAPSLYAAFRSKDALYAEALERYATVNEHFVWAGFSAATTARDAVRALLMDSAAALTGCVADLPRGCMVALSSVASEGHAELGRIVVAARAVTFARLTRRFERAEAEGEIPHAVPIEALARFVQTIQNGMSILARDGASRLELEGVADIALAGWDARVGATPQGLG